MVFLRASTKFNIKYLLRFRRLTVHPWLAQGLTGKLKGLRFVGGK